MTFFEAHKWGDIHATAFPKTALGSLYMLIGGIKLHSKF